LPFNAVQELSCTDKIKLNSNWLNMVEKNEILLITRQQPTFLRKYFLSDDYRLKKFLNRIGVYHYFRAKFRYLFMDAMKDPLSKTIALIKSSKKSMLIG